MCIDNLKHMRDQQSENMHHPQIKENKKYTQLDQQFDPLISPPAQSITTPKPSHFKFIPLMLIFALLILCSLFLNNFFSSTSKNDSASQQPATSEQSLSNFHEQDKMINRDENEVENYEQGSKVENGVILEYKRNEEQIEEVIREMRNPELRFEKRNKNKKQSTEQEKDKAYFAYSLQQQTDNQDYLQAQYRYFDQNYHFQTSPRQLPLCLVMVGRNLGNQYFKMFNSIQRQNYTNYKAIYVDDNSDDKTTRRIQEHVSKLPTLSKKLKVQENTERVYALANKHQAISEFCAEEDIVLDMDADDWLIGNQVLKLINNAYYKHEDRWVIYFSSIFWQINEPVISSFGFIPDEVLESGTYRTEDLWKTSHLRTFKKKIYQKIDPTDFQNSQGYFYRWKSDAFIHYPLVELAGKNHTIKIEQCVYFYDKPYVGTSKEKSEARLIAKSQTPYEPLEWLGGEGKKKKRYRVPEALVGQLKKVEEQESEETFLKRKKYNKQY